MDINNIINSLTALDNQALENTINSLMLIADKLKNQVNENENKEKIKTELLQQDQNLADEIKYTKNIVDSLTKEYDDICAKLDKARIKLRKLEVERENIHQRWIKINPANKAKPINKSIDSIINALRDNNYKGVMTPSKKYNSSYDVFLDFYDIDRKKINRIGILEFKKFDNLIKRRCKTATIFGVFFTRDKLISSLTEAQKEYCNQF